MKSISEIFDNSKELLDSISYFIDKYDVGVKTPLYTKKHDTWKISYFVVF